MVAKTDAFTADLARLAAVAKALAHPARLQILETLAARDTCLCGDLVDVLPLAQASVSRHLKTLKKAGLIRGEVDGPRSCYCLDAEAVQAAAAAFGAFFAPLTATPAADDCC